ncbi:MAG: 3-hydroxyacyl-CoA dehydrogenase NAD-binding domain-containing protein, partial [Amnibacterium sp.]
KDDKGEVKGFDKRALALVKRSLPKDAAPMTAEAFRLRVEDGLADEIHRMLEDGVVASPADIDLCLILGAGYPFHAGGITPYLDRVGASERVFGGTFHTPRIAGPANR